MKFTATVLLAGKTATGVLVPSEVVEALGGGKRPKVVATIGDFSWRNSVAPMNGCYMLGINADVRAATGVAADDVVEIDLALDTAPREVVVPADFAAALAQDPVAEQFYNGLSYTLRKLHVTSVEGAKSEATRQRRIEKSVALLAAGKAR